MLFDMPLGTNQTNNIGHSIHDVSVMIFVRLGVSVFSVLNVRSKKISYLCFLYVFGCC